ncbi:MAG: heavy-metal-associated domain-containing protein [Candidatus Izemoplasmatales bacterium]
MKATEFKVTGMTCGGCENSVKRVVKQLPGVQEVKASHADRSVSVFYDDKQLNEGQILDQIKKLGYEAEVK